MTRAPGFFALRLNSLRFGALLPFRALKLIVTQPTLLFWSLLPVSITLALYGFVIVRAQTAARELLMHQLTLWGWDPHGWLATVLVIFARLVLLLVGALTFSLVASISASPFNDFLAERTEKFAKPTLPPVVRAGFLAKIRLIGIDLGKSIAAAVVTLAALILSWIPGLNIAAFAVAFLLVTFQYISYPQTRRGMKLRDSVKFLGAHAWTSVAFGGVLSFLFAIPIVSAFTVPLAVVGGTLLVARARGEPPLK